jgi:ABC-2 type transport system permease protein
VSKREASRSARRDGDDAIYTLGYERYQGPRRDRATRFWIIARNVARQAWKSTWGVKLPLVLSSMVVVGACVAMWALRHRIFDMVRQAAAESPVPIAVPGVEAALYVSVSVFAFLAFVLTTVVGCRAIADDLRMGAFQFYFSRPLQASDYVLGKLAGVLLIVGMPMFAGPVILALVRLLFAEGAADAWAHADIVPRAMAVGLVGTVSYAIVGLALGALVRRRIWAQAGFAIYYLVLANLIKTAANSAGEPLLALASIDANLTSVGVALLDAPLPPDTLLPPAWAAAVFTALLVGLGLAAILWRVRSAETAALGGSS